MSLSLIAVFIPILLMGGIVGRLFREFAVTLSIAIADLAGRLADHDADDVRAACCGAGRGRARPAASAATERGFDAMLGFYAARSRCALRHPLVVVLSLLGTIGLNVYLFVIDPEGLFPAAGHRPLIGGIQADQSISFQAMQQKLDPVA